MSTLMGILVGIGSVIVLLLILALFVEKTFHLEREIVINRSKEDVFNYIKYLKNQDHYSKWVMTDPLMKKEFKGVDGTVGFIYAWDGNKKAGAGEQEIKKIVENESMDAEVRFIRPFAATSQIPFKLESVSPTQTRFKWGLSGRTPYPLNLMTVMMRGTLSKDIDISLSNLKHILEQ